MSSDIADFHRLNERIKLSGILTTCTALRIGSGNAGELDAVDLPVLKDADGFPLIPGSSIKGALRSTIEALVRGAERHDQGIWACDPLAKFDEQNDTSRQAACGAHDHGERAQAASRIDQHCAACQLFGSFVLASHVRFCDAMLLISAEDRRRGRVPLEFREGVAIDRDLRRVAGTGKFDFEVVSPGAAFALEIFVENPKPWLMGLLMMGFDQIAKGFTALGGFTSRGLGRVDIEWHTLSRAKAADLLEGRDPVELEGERKDAEFSAWRDALAKKYQGAA